MAGPFKMTGFSGFGNSPLTDKLKRKKAKLEKTKEQLSNPNIKVGKWKRKLKKYRKTKTQVEELGGTTTGKTRDSEPTPPTEDKPSIRLPAGGKTRISL